jgi:hypothetical protein
MESVKLDVLVAMLRLDEGLRLDLLLLFASEFVEDLLQRVAELCFEGHCDLAGDTLIVERQEVGGVVEGFLVDLV